MEDFFSHRKNGRWAGLSVDGLIVCSFYWADSISQFGSSYIYIPHASMTGAPAIWGPRAAAPPANTTGPALALGSGGEAGFRFFR